MNLLPDRLWALIPLLFFRQSRLGAVRNPYLYPGALDVRADGSGGGARIETYGPPDFIFAFDAVADRAPACPVRCDRGGEPAGRRRLTLPLNLQSRLGRRNGHSFDRLDMAREESAGLLDIASAERPENEAMVLI